MIRGACEGKLRGMSELGQRCVRAVALLGLATGCTGGTETGNPPFVAALAYTGTSSAPEDYALDSRGAVATVRSAWLDLEAVTLTPEGSCDGTGQPLVSPALGVGDHAAGAHVETSFEASAGRFCTATLPFVRARTVPSSAPEELEGRSVLLLGELSDGTPFSIASELEPRFELAAISSGIQLSPGDASLLVAFDFAAWLRPVRFAVATREDGQIHIDAGSNPELLARFEAALGEGVALYRDPNADGVLDDDSELLARPR
ncbi:MAG: hypothetical protein K0R38_2160 [Polyangiaceae bacterium]|jgi:hypothetical protein|nr:hypothetical protein [Polyangiaceae bacterium]